jgi:hypothetical protein
LGVAILGRVLGGLFGKGSGEPRDNAYYYYLRCGKCGERIRVRVDRANDLAQDYDGAGDNPSGYSVTKGVVGKKCFRTISLTVKFDGARRETARSIDGGEFITTDEYAAEEAEAPGSAPT